MSANIIVLVSFPLSNPQTPKRSKKGLIRKRDQQVLLVETGYSSEGLVLSYDNLFSLHLTCLLVILVY